MLCTQGVLHASGHHILFVDADGATHFPDLALLEEELDKLEVAQASASKGAPHGLVVGSRAHLVATEAVVKVRLALSPSRSWAVSSALAGRRHADALVAPSSQRSALRNLLMRSFHLYLSLLGLSTIRDTQCGFKLHARASAQLLYPALHSPGWIFDCELLLVAERCGVPLREVGVRWTEVPGSKLDVVTDSIRMARDLLVIRGNYLAGRWTTPGRVPQEVVQAARAAQAAEGRKER